MPSSKSRSSRTSTRRSSRVSNSGYEANRSRSSRSSRRVRRAPGHYEHQFITDVEEMIDAHPERINKIFDRRRIDAAKPKARESMSLLEIAADNGYASAVKMLLNRGADTKNNTPLSIACEKGYSDIVDSLLAAGMSPNATESASYIPIHKAIDVECISCIKSLLKYGADVNAADELGTSALRNAISYENPDIVKLLIKAGANVNNESGANYSTILLWACYTTNSLPILQALLDAGADPNAAGKPDNMTPLHVACEEGKLSFVRALIKAGANVDAKAKGDLTPLHYAAEHNHSDIIDVLVKDGHATIDPVNSKGFTPLYIACVRGNLEAAKRLLQLGADIKAGTRTVHARYEKRIFVPETLEMLDYYIKHHYPRFRRRHAVAAWGTRRRRISLASATRRRR